MEQELGRGEVENTNQSRHADGNPSPNLTNQDLPTPGDDRSVSLSSDPEGTCVQSVPPEFTEDVDWRNPYQTSLSSPPTQSMVHEDGYDPNRIPSSVFADTPASPTDWSSSSNESLFSISMGYSFSGHQGAFKSEELGTIEGMNSPRDPSEFFEAKANPDLPETFPEPETQQSADTKDDIRIQEGPSEKSTAMTEESKENHGTTAYHEETKVTSSTSTHKGGVSPFERTNSIQSRLSNVSAQSSSSKNRLSEASTKSASSFAFPVLLSDFGKSRSIRLSVKKEEPQIKQKSEPNTPVTQQAVRRRCCSSFIPGWLRCC